MSPPASIENCELLGSLRLLVGISDMKVASDPRVSLVTHSLGSCIAVVVSDTVAAVGGLLHFQLPDAAQGSDKASRNPFMFSDTGIPLLMEKVFAEGAAKSRLTVKLLGGANIMDKKGLFNIGKRNYVAAKKMLWRLGCFVSAEDVGGESWRTVLLQVGTGIVTVKSSTCQYQI